MVLCIPLMIEELLLTLPSCESCLIRLAAWCMTDCRKNVEHVISPEIPHSLVFFLLFFFSVGATLKAVLQTGILRH